MISIEQVEKLLTYADVTFEEARAALESTDGNLLDAIVLLERRGKVISPAGRTTSQTGAITVLPGNAQQQQQYKEPIHRSSFAESADRFTSWVCDIFDKAFRTTFYAARNGNDILSVPLLILILIGLFAFWVVVPLLLLGLIFGFRYRLGGPDVKVEKVNHVFDQAANATESAVHSVRNTVDAVQKNVWQAPPVQPTQPNAAPTNHVTPEPENQQSTNSQKL